MGFFRSFTRAIRRPIRSVVKIVKNPAKKILPRNIRESKIYKKVGRPLIKIGAGVALGALTGGVSVGLSGVAFVGLSTAGAVAGGLTSAAAGGLTSKAFKPVKHALLPAAAGFIAGNAARNLSAIEQAASGAKDAAVNAAKKEAARVAKQIATATNPVELGKTAAGFAGSALAAQAAKKPAQAVPSIVISSVPAVTAEKTAQQQNNTNLALLATVGVALLSV